MLLPLQILYTIQLVAQYLKVHRTRTGCLLYLLLAQGLVNQGTLLIYFTIHDILSMIRQR